MDRDDEVDRLGAQLKCLQGEIEDRTQWAIALDEEVKRRVAEVARLHDELNQEKFRSASWEVSRWIHLGRALGLGPKL
jgi:hypothetical protein